MFAQGKVIQPTLDQQLDQLLDKDPKITPRAEISRDNDPSKHPGITVQATISSTHHDLLPAATEIPTNVNSDEPEDFDDHNDTGTNSDGLEDSNNEDNISTNSDEPDYSKDIEVEKDSEISANPNSKELEEFNDPAAIVSKDIEWAVDEKQGLLGARRLGEEWEFLTPFETTFEPDHKLLNCEELIQKFNADYGPSKRLGTTRSVEPRDPEKESIYPIDKEGFVGREYVDGELRD
ncbi:unnamed protein product [Clonostachys rhizophaga]|uniref:Uncharacterized protein n=1 Tax=Clonostachys rhizophaga TaxID=160324 RepID=A0A9N9YP98_9HYPO|nr:unnamed protein product [Clonostachys rhizophaga]